MMDRGMPIILRRASRAGRLGAGVSGLVGMDVAA